MSHRHRLNALERRLPVVPRKLGQLTADQLIELGTRFEQNDPRDPQVRDALIRFGGLRLLGRRFEDVPVDDVSQALIEIATQLDT